MGFKAKLQHMAEIDQYDFAHLSRENRSAFSFPVRSSVWSSAGNGWHAGPNIDLANQLSQGKVSIGRALGSRMLLKIHPVTVQDLGWADQNAMAISGASA